MVDMPYFMTDEKWYYFDFVDKRFKLTKIAPEKAKKSYVDYYNELRGDQYELYKS